MVILIVMIRDAAVSSYKKSSEETKNLILEIFNGKDNKVYTCLGTNRLKKIFKDYKITLQEHLETELNKKLLSPAVGGSTLLPAKNQVQEEMKSTLKGIYNENTLKFNSKLSGIKRTSWHTSWLFKQATIIISAITSTITTIITYLLTKHYLT